MVNRKKLSATTALLTVLVVSAACEQEGPIGTGIQEPGIASLDSTFSTNPNRRFDQVERLGNPLTAEVFIEKREHDAYDAFPAKQDPGHFTDDIVAFLTTVAGRDAGFGGTVASVLVGTAANPGDKIAVYTTRAPGVTAANMATAANVGWLTPVLDPTNGYGGRKLAGDDVVDKGLLVTFGAILGRPATAPALTTDNVPANDKTPTSTFPYLPPPTM